jgi:hypothetical protein
MCLEQDHQKKMICCLEEQRMLTGKGYTNNQSYPNEQVNKVPQWAKGVDIPIGVLLNNQNTSLWYRNNSFNTQTNHNVQAMQHALKQNGNMDNNVIYAVDILLKELSVGNIENINGVITWYPDLDGYIGKKPGNKLRQLFYKLCH